MTKCGCPSRFIAMVRLFHDGMQARVQTNEHIQIYNAKNMHKNAQFESYERLVNSKMTIKFKEF